MKTTKPVDLGEYRVLTLHKGETFPEPLPTQVRVIDDQHFHKVDLDAMRLPVAGGARSIRLRDNSQGLARATADIFHAVILGALNGQRKASTVRGWCWVFGHFLRTVRPWTEADVCTITVQMFVQGTKGWHPSQEKLLRSCLRFWMSKRYPGLHADLKALITRSRSPKPPSTTQIQASNARERPFSIAQATEIVRAIERAYISGTFSPQVNLLWRLIVSEALRPSQLEALQVRDVDAKESGNWTSVEVMFPWVKQHGKGTREHLIRTPVSPSVGRALRDHLQYMAAVNGGPLPPEQPLFSVVEATNVRTLKSKPIGIVQLITRTRVHIASACENLDDIDLFTRRFKHTKLTHLAMLGAPVDVLARAAFQSTQGTVSRYVNLNEEAFTDYEARMDSHFSWLHRCFEGEIDDASAKPFDPSNAVLSPSLEGVVGRCKCSPCGVLAPFGCYVCPRFVAFKDGPHGEVLAQLLKRKHIAIKMELPRETVERDDNLIAAVQYVVDVTGEQK